MSFATAQACNDTDMQASVAVGTFRAQPQKKVALSIFRDSCAEFRQMTIQSASIQTQQNPVLIMFPLNSEYKTICERCPPQHFVQEVRAFGHSPHYQQLKRHQCWARDSANPERCPHQRLIGVKDGMCKMESPDAFKLRVGVYLCSECKSGYYSTSWNRSCSQCPGERDEDNQVTTELIIVLIVLVLLALLSFAVILVNARVEGLEASVCDEPGGLSPMSFRVCKSSPRFLANPLATSLLQS